MNMLNMRLLISVIGQTFARSQISRVYTKYDMKTQYLSEVSEFLNRLSGLRNIKTSEDDDGRGENY